MTSAEIQYVSDEEGKPTAVLVPIDLWREIAAEKETAHRLSSEAMRRRLLEASRRTEGISFDQARAKLGVWTPPASRTSPGGFAGTAKPPFPSSS